jgi:ATP dependent DNA ligase domain
MKRITFIHPMECALVSKLPEGPDWTYEVKLDGYRAIGVRTSNETILYSRNHKYFNRRFPQIADALPDLPADSVIDGEVVALDESGRPYLVPNLPLFRTERRNSDHCHAPAGMLKKVKILCVLAWRRGSYRVGLHQFFVVLLSNLSSTR